MRCDLKQYFTNEVKGYYTDTGYILFLESMVTSLQSKVEKLTDTQQLKAEIALLCAELEESLCYRGRSVNEIIVSMRQLSAV